MTSMDDMTPVAKILARAYRHAEPQDQPQKLPQNMQDLLRRLRQQDEDDT